MSNFLVILLAIALVALNGFFVAAEFAMIRVRRTRVEELATQGDSGAKVVLRILSRLDIFLAATQLGITMANLGLGWVGEPAMERLLKPLFGYFHVVSPHVADTIALVVGFGIITITEVVFGELLPKWSVIESAERAAKFVAYPMDLFVRLFYPLIVFLRWFASLFARLVGINAAAVGMVDSPHTEDEIISIIEQAEQSGTIGQSEAEIVDNVFEFAHTQVKEIMAPRVDVVAMDASWPVAQSVEVASVSGFTRFPVCEGDRDHIIGMIHIKDLLSLAARPDEADLRSIVRNIPAVPETKRIDQLLRELQRAHSHMAIVLDEYGGTAGVVTIEDILEELVGEIQDEYDRPAPVEHLDDGRIAISGTEPLDTVTEELGLELENGEDYQTVGGYARHVLGLTASSGAKTRIGNYTITVAEAQGQRISRLIFAKLSPEGEDTAGERSSPGNGSGPA